MEYYKENRTPKRPKAGQDQPIRLIPCDKDCLYQQQGYCALDEITYLSSRAEDGCGYFTHTDPYGLSDDRDGL